MNYKQIQNTFVYNNLNNDISKMIAEALSNCKEISNIEIAEQILMINKYVNSAIKGRVMNEFDAKNIRLVYLAEDVKIPTAIPFIMTARDGKIIPVIFINNYGNLRADGTIYMEYRKLYTLMESAYLAKNFLLKYDRYRTNNVVIQQGCSIYANMFIKPINKKFNLHVDRNRENKVLFLSAKFYLRNVLGIQNDEIVFNNALKACKTGNPILLQEIDHLVPDEAFINLGTFIDALKNPQLNLGLNSLTARGYLEGYIGLYGGTALFALEMFPYFLFVGDATINSMGIVRNISLEDIMEKGMPKILAQFYM